MTKQTLPRTSMLLLLALAFVGVACSASGEVQDDAQASLDARDISLPRRDTRPDASSLDAAPPDQDQPIDASAPVTFAPCEGVATVGVPACAQVAPLTQLAATSLVRQGLFGPEVSLDEGPFEALWGDARALDLGAGAVSFWMHLDDLAQTASSRPLLRLLASTADGHTAEISVAQDGARLEVALAGRRLTVDLAVSEEWRSEAVRAREWHHVVISWDEGDLRLYLDGGLRGRTSGPCGPCVGTATGAVIGGPSADASRLADVQLYSRRLYHAEAQWIFERALRERALDVDVGFSLAGQRTATVSLPRGPAMTPAMELVVTPRVAIEAGGRVRLVLMHSFSNYWPIQSEDPTVDNFVSVRWPAGVSGRFGCETSPRLPAVRRCTAGLDAGRLEADDELVFSVKNVRFGRPTISNRDSFNIQARFLLDTGPGTAAGGALLPARSVGRIAVTADRSGALTVFSRAPSTVVAGESFGLHLWQEYAEWQPALDDPIEVNTVAAYGLNGLPTSMTREPDKYGASELPGLSLGVLQEGQVTAVRGAGPGGHALNTNPIQRVAPGAKRLYWGELHGHTTASDGIEKPQHFFPFARSRALSFATITDHMVVGDVYAPVYELEAINPRTWTEQLQLARDHDAPGRFVPLVGYEFSHGKIADLLACKVWTCPKVDGDWNVIFSTLDPPLLVADHVTAGDGLFSRVRSADAAALVIPHYGGRRANLSLIAGAPAGLIPAVEIVSNHARKPEAFQDWAFELLSSYDHASVNVGFIGSPDDHSGHPGRSQFGSAVGSLAVWADDLSRASLMDAISRRHTYAYSFGDRPIIRFFAQGGQAMMGDGLELPAPALPELSLEVIGVRRITGVALYRDGKRIWETVPVVRQENSVNRAEISYRDETFVSGARYHFVVEFDGAGYAWVSPITVTRP